MFVTWGTSPAVPGTLTSTSGITLSAAKFQLAFLEVIGDSGDTDATTRKDFLVAWDDSGGPQQEEFPDAVPGLYSQVALKLQGDFSGSDPIPSFEIDGTWHDDRIPPGRDQQFSFISPFTLDIDAGCDQPLQAGSSATLSITIDLDSVVGQTDFSRLRDVNNDGILDLSDSNEARNFAQRLTDAFKVDSSARVH